MSPRSKSPAKSTRPPGCRVRDTDLRKFAAGRHHTIHEKLGAHLTTVDGKAGVSFGVWAPGAATVSTAPVRRRSRRLRAAVVVVHSMILCTTDLMLEHHAVSVILLVSAFQH